MQKDLYGNFGDIDIYLFDQLLKGTYDRCEKVLDAGCGSGRNLTYFIQQGFDVFGVDSDRGNISKITALSRKLAPSNPLSNFQVAPVEALPFEDESFDLVISSAVLHFARNQEHFEAMLQSMWRVLKPGGFLFARIASDIGIEKDVKHLGNGQYLLPDGSERFLVNTQKLLKYSDLLDGSMHEPLKTTNVQGVRCMTTWCLEKL